MNILNTKIISKNPSHVSMILQMLDHKKKEIGKCNFTYGKENGYVNNLYVDEEHRKKGLGFLLLDKAKNIMSSHHVKKCILFAHRECEYDDGLLQFYKKNGFQIDDSQKETHYDDGEKIFIITKMVSLI